MVAIVSGNSLGLNSSSLATLGQSGSIGVATFGANDQAAYVNIATGNLVLQNADDFVASVGAGTQILRTYNSQGQMNGGASDWTTGPYLQPLTLSGTLNTVGSTLTRIDTDGSSCVYGYDVTRGAYVSTTGAGAVNLIQYDPVKNQYVWTNGSTGAVDRYDGSSPSHLLSSSDASGNTTYYNYGSNGQISSIVDASGETSYFEYTGSNLTSIRNVTSDGSVTSNVSYGYDSSNRLTSVVVSLSSGSGAGTSSSTFTTTYAYDGTSQRVTSIAQSDGTALTIGYVQVNGTYKVASVTDGLSQKTQFSYNTTTNQTTVTDPLGNVSNYQYDASGNLTNVQTAVSASHPTGVTQVSYTYNARNEVTSVTDGMGQTTTYQYDANGNQILSQDAAGNVVSSTYNSLNQVISRTTSNPSQPTVSSTVRYVYDASGKDLLRFQVNADGSVTQYQYNALGQRTSVISYGSGTYTGSGQPTEAQLVSWAAAQDLTQTQRVDTTYDFRGQVSTVTTYESISATGVGTQPSVTQYVYSPSGQLLKTVTPNGAVSTWAYDELGRVILATSPSSDGVTANTTSTTYSDASGTATSVTSTGLTTVSTYDKAGRLTSVVRSSAGANLGTTTYAYDQDNRLVMTQDPTGVTTWMVYDAAGRKVADVDGTGAVIGYVYNADNLVTETIRYANTISTSTAPSLTQIQALASSADRKSWQLYDSDGRVVWSIDAAGNVTQNEYDNNSRLINSTQLAVPVNTSLLGDGTQFAPSNVASQTSPVGGLTTSMLALQTSATTVLQGAAVTLTATVLGSGPTGIINFYAGSKLLGDAQLVNGVATLSVVLPTGANQLSAKYAGDASNAASTSAVVTASVTAVTPVTVSSSSASVVAGGNVTLIANVGGTSPSGTVAFFDGLNLLGTAQVVNGVASLYLVAGQSGLSVGSNGITASYAGDSTHPAGVSVAFNQTVTAAVANSGTLGVYGMTVSPSVATTSSNLTLTVNVGGNSPTGTVTFLDGSNVVAVAQVVNGVATASVTGLSVGNHSLTASYSGDANNAASVSAQ
ncbi:MAG: Ig-like domain repeat protein, partial [Curvibacter sp.]|nr:Ig-like domain repeat protein [Curvibacter sp.]